MKSIHDCLSLIHDGEGQKEEFQRQIAFHFASELSLIFLLDMSSVPLSKRQKKKKKNRLSLCSCENFIWAHLRFLLCERCLCSQALSPSNAPLMMSGRPPSISFVILYNQWQRLVLPFWLWSHLWCAPGEALICIPKWSWTRRIHTEAIYQEMTAFLQNVPMPFSRTFLPNLLGAECDSPEWLSYLQGSLYTPGILVSLVLSVAGQSNHTWKSKVCDVLVIMLVPLL